jgi:cellulose synthase/poly-beta-1,6-N-acetylglucosamine synthase-like glycosyltransferase
MCNVVPVIVPIFDGVGKMSKSTAEFVKEYYPEVFASVPSIDLDSEKNGVKSYDEIAGKVGIKVACSEWIYEYDEPLKKEYFESEDLRSLFAKDLDANHLHFFIVPILKAANYSKRHSHDCFFKIICDGISDNLSTVLLTDCGTIFDKHCLSYMVKELYMNNDLIGVTARQRVLTPGPTFHPCHASGSSCFSGLHVQNGEGKQKTCCCCNCCWKCWVNFFLSPAPLQGFEFEATLLLNSAMFNLIEALPVMPGPCQLFKWKRLKQFHVPEKYMDMLLKGKSKEFSVIEMFRIVGGLAEDRMLTFVAVGGTGFGTKWALGSVFYYEPQMTWSSLLKQRRRWINGTFACFLYLFFDKKASDYIHGGLFDDHKFSKSPRLMYSFWGIPLYQLFLVLISPSVFGASVYISLHDLHELCPQAFRWINNSVNLYDYQIVDILTIVFMALYGIWMIYSFYVKDGTIPEWLCVLFVILGILYVVPIHFSIWYSLFTLGISPVSGLVLFNLILPILLAVPQSITSGLLYLLYLPWFLTLIIFYLLYIPAYSLARLWDTTWGNRATGKDKELKTENENYLKKINFRLIIILIVVNCFLTWSIVELYLYDQNYVIGIMIILFFPMFIQLLSSLFFLFIVVPGRTLFSSRSEERRIK